MSEKITDEEISLYLSGDLSSKDEERVKKAADKDPKIAATLEDIQITREIFKEDAVKNYPMPDNMFNNLEKIVENENFESNVKSTDKSSSFSFYKYFTTAFGGAFAGGLAIYLIFFQMPQMAFRSIDDNSQEELFKIEDQDAFIILSKIDNPDGWNIYKSLMFRVENKNNKKSLLNGSNIILGEKLKITFFFFKNENRVTTSFNDFKDEDIKVYNKSDKDVFEKTIRSDDDNIFRLSIDSKWFEENEKDPEIENIKFELNILKP